MISRYFQPFFKFIKTSTIQSFAIKKSSTKFQSITSNFQITKKSIYLRSTIYTFSQHKNSDPTRQLKNQSKQFYQNYVDDIIELQKSTDWQQVIANTSQPLIIDFYADWCQPCKKLTPILEERVKKLQGKVKLLKVNIDKCGQIAHQLKITSVPTVFAVFRGQGIDSFQGLPETSKIDKFFETLNKVSQIANSEDKAYEILNQGKKLLAEQKFAQAQKIFLQFNEKGVDEQLVAVKQALLAQCYLSLKKFAKLNDQIQRMKRFEALYLQNPQLKDFYELLVKQNQRIAEEANQNPEISSLKTQIQSQPSTLNLKFRLFEVYKQNEMIEDGLESLVEIMKTDKNWEDKKANKAMLAIFKQLGNASPVTQKYRKIMQRILY